MAPGQEEWLAGKRKRHRKGRKEGLRMRKKGRNKVVVLEERNKYHLRH